MDQITRWRSPSWPADDSFSPGTTSGPPGPGPAPAATPTPDPAGPGPRRSRPADPTARDGWQPVAGQAIRPR